MTSDRAVAVAALIRSSPHQSLIALDIDGTLAPLVDRPEDSQAVPGTIETLRRLRGRGVEVVLITGRPVLDAVRIVGLTDTDDIPVVGQYGLQRWAHGVVTSPPPSPEIEYVRSRLVELLADAPTGVHVEDKELALVIHSRPAADPGEALARLLPALHQLVDPLGLELLAGRSVVEIRPAGSDKGAVLLEVASDRPWSSAVYIGDDVGDLPAFEALTAIAESGVATLAGAVVDPTTPDGNPAVAAVADVLFASAHEVVEWLDALG